MFFVDKKQIDPLMPNFLKIPPMPLVNIFIAHYPESTLGAYHEAMVLIQATYKPEREKKIEGFYCPFIYVDSDVALACGREIWGFPKRLADITIINDQETVCGTVQRKGVRLLEITVTPNTPGTTFPSAIILTIKQIPSSEVSPIVGIPNLVVNELVKTDFQITPCEVSTGPLTVGYQESKDDPLYQLMPKSLVQGTHLIANMVIFNGIILQKFI